MSNPEKLAYSLKRTEPFDSENGHSIQTSAADRRLFEEYRGASDPSHTSFKRSRFKEYDEDGNSQRIFGNPAPDIVTRVRDRNLENSNAETVNNLVDTIHNARGVFITDGGAITETLKNTSEADLRVIQARYKEKYGISLREELRHDFDLPILGDVRKKGQQAEALLDYRDRVLMPAERSNLNDIAKTALSTADYVQFHQQMTKFEERGAQKHLSSNEIAKTYREVSRILKNPGKNLLDDNERKRLAMQIMDNAAAPTTISQGFDQTCSAAALETTLYTKAPSEAARIVGEISRIGSYIDRSGNVVRLSPEARTSASLVYPNPDGTRNHASEIFQIAVVNLSYLERGVERTYDQLKIPYRQNADDNGERLYDTSKKPPVEVIYPDGEPVRSPELSINDVVDLYKGITGSNSLEAIRASILFEDKDANVTDITSEQQLNEELAQAKKNGNFPMIVLVNTFIEPLWSDSGGGVAGGAGGAHVLTVTDFTPGPPAKVNIENQWGENANYQGDKMMSLHDLFAIMQPTSFAVRQEQTELQQSGNDGRLDLKKEIDFLRLEHSDRNKISIAAFEKQYQSLTDRIIADVHRRGSSVTSEEKKNITVQLTEAGKVMSLPAQLNTFTRIHESGISSNLEFDSSVADLGYQILLEQQQYLSKHEGSASLRRQYSENTATFRDYVTQLPDEDQAIIFYNLNIWDSNSDTR